MTDSVVASITDGQVTVSDGVVEGHSGHGVAVGHSGHCRRKYKGNN